MTKAASWLVPQLFEHNALLLGVATLVNAAATFMGAMAIALLAARLSGSARVAKFILLMPWVRVVWDVLQGASPNAYVLSEYAGTKGTLGSFQLGLGARILPVVQAHLGMQGGEHRFDYSVGDMVAHGLYRYQGSAVLALSLSCVLAVSAALLVRRTRQLFLWRALLAQAEASAQCVQRLRLGRRSVRVLEQAKLELGPCTSGLLHPRIWLPQGLDAAQRQAALEHELAHARDGDVLWFAWVGVLADLFWFVPGARFLERRVRDSAEQAADAQAVARGVSPKALAATIVAQAATLPAAGLPARLGGTAARLERRLLALAPRPRSTRWQRALRALGAVAFTGSVFLSVFGGYS